MRLGFSKINGKLIVKYVPTFLPILRVHFKKKKKRSVKDLSNDAYAIFCGVFFFVIFFIKAYVMGTHLICIDKSMQFKWVPTTFAFKKYTGCNLKTTQLCDCALIGVCAVIRLNPVYSYIFLV